jgi:hypothetical protein
MTLRTDDWRGPARGLKTADSQAAAPGLVTGAARRLIAGHETGRIENRRQRLKSDIGGDCLLISRTEGDRLDSMRVGSPRSF